MSELKQCPYGIMCKLLLNSDRDHVLSYTHNPLSKQNNTEDDFDKYFGKLSIRPPKQQHRVATKPIKRLIRPCKYGIKCNKRGDKLHMESFTHDELQQCKFGTKCKYWVNYNSENRNPLDCGHCNKWLHSMEPMKNKPLKTAPLDNQLDNQLDKQLDKDSIEQSNEQLDKDSIEQSNEQLGKDSIEQSNEQLGKDSIEQSIEQSDEQPINQSWADVE